MSARNRPVATGTPSCERGDHRVDERLGVLGPCGLDPARAAALEGVAVERELADDEHAAADVDDRPVHHAVVVVEDAQAGDLVGQPLRCRGSVRWVTPTSTHRPASIEPTTSNGSSTEERLAPTP